MIDLFEKVWKGASLVVAVSVCFTNILMEQIVTCAGDNNIDIKHCIISLNSY